MYPLAMWRWVVLLAVATAPGGCPDPTSPPTTDASITKPSTTDGPSDDESGSATPVSPLPVEPPGWLRIERLRDHAPGGWATGALLTDNHIVLQTESVNGLALDLDQLPLCWDRRVILQINAQRMELRRKRAPVLRLRMTPAGDWVVTTR